MFLVFAGSFYYPSGGWDDYQETFETAEEAVRYAKSLYEDWWHVVELGKGEVFWGKRNDPEEES